jgi:CDGSH-type Zn-finger protein
MMVVTYTFYGINPSSLPRALNKELTSMTEPVCAQKGPYILELEPGDYWWCVCGRSKKQPFCDGSHKVTEFSPMKFSVTEKKKYYLCGCKHSAKKPFCDGTHNKL